VVEIIVFNNVAVSTCSVLPLVASGYVLLNSAVVVIFVSVVVDVIVVVGEFCVYDVAFLMLLLLMM